MTAVEWLVNYWKKLQSQGEKMTWNEIIGITKLAKEMEKEKQIEFACQVYDKYNFGTQEISFREECEQFKQQEQ
jgi:hypothetical protein